MTDNEHQTHLVRFYPQQKLSQSPKKITTEQDLDAAETPTEDKTNLAKEQKLTRKPE